MERRPSNNIKLSNLKSTSHYDASGDLNQKRGKHVVISTDNGGNRINVSTKTSSIIYETKVSNKTPLLLHEYKNASCQTRPPKRPSSLYTKHEMKPSKHSSKIRSHSIDNTETKKKCSSLERLHKLKEKFLHSNTDVIDKVSDDESTPLVSDLSSPITLSPSDKSSCSSSLNSDPLTPSSSSKRCDRLPNFSSNNQKLSEHNLADITEVTPTASLQDSSLYYPQTSEATRSTSPERPKLRLRTMSECTDGSVSVLESNTKLVTASNISLYSKGSQSSGHLSRQDALDSETDLTDVFCDPIVRT